MPQIEPYNSSATATMPHLQEQTIQFSQEVLFRVNPKRAASLMSRSVNNYLKTEEEIETEFCYAALDVTTLNKDGYSNIHSLDDMISGTMEENY